MTSPGWNLLFEWDSALGRYVANSCTFGWGLFVLVINWVPGLVAVVEILTHYRSVSNSICCHQTLCFVRGEFFGVSAEKTKTDKKKLKVIAFFHIHFENIILCRNEGTFSSC